MDCKFLMAMVPCTVLIIFATVIIVGPIIETRADMIVQPLLLNQQANMLCLPTQKCLYTMMYYAGEQSIVHKSCVSCIAQTSIDATIYYSLVNKYKWEYERFGSLPTAIALYACALIWVGIVAFVAYNTRNLRPVAIVPQPEEPQTLQVRPRQSPEMIDAYISQSITMEKVAIGRNSNMQHVVVIQP